MMMIKKIFLTALLLLISFTSLHAQTDTLTREQFIHSQTIKSDTLNRMALQLAVPGANQADLNKAINLIMKGLHTYAKFRDSVGLRETFDHLALVYHLQKKYVQAKWFYIQSNTLAREMKDTANIIHSLIALSAVKGDIKDYAMANRDLAEAVQLAKNQPGIAAQVEVQSILVKYYTKKGDADKAALANDRVQFLNDSVTRIADIRKIAMKQSQPVTVKSVIIKKPETVEKTSRTVIILITIIVVISLVLFLLYFKKRVSSK